MDPIVPSAEVLARLLDPADPALRTKVLTDLLGRPTDDAEVVAARDKVPEQPWIKATLAAHHGDGTWGRGFYHKYDGTSWSMLHLSEVGAPMDHPAIEAGVERLLATASDPSEIKGYRGDAYRDLEGGAHWKYPIPCLMAHMALVLTRAGLSEHEVTRSALQSCIHRFGKGIGFGCFVNDDSLLPACVMTVPKVLKAFLAIPESKRTTEDRVMIGNMVEVLKRNGLYRYVPQASKEWGPWAHKASAEERREAKPRWIAEGRLEPKGPKPGWLRFSFPHSYNSDLLEVMLMVGEADGSRDGVVDHGLEVVRSKRSKDGMWKMVGGLNGKMHADLDK
ncbi:MAG: hypothetical protein KJN92_16600, partial [Gemmatimonadetes bacterium]|nr:hypothetical protein [Gemmatimonadota bacterium]